MPDILRLVVLKGECWAALDLGVCIGLEGGAPVAAGGQA